MFVGKVEDGSTATSWSGRKSGLFSSVVEFTTCFSTDGMVCYALGASTKSMFSGPITCCFFVNFESARKTFAKSRRSVDA